jgi:carbonic anhydrase/acetyltransferase-like protein (isoleucine patch superfamily)
VTGNTRIPPGSPVLGSPARVVRACGPKEREMIEQGVREYRQRLQDYRQGERAQVRS